MTKQVFSGPGHLSVSQIHAIQENPWHWFLERVARVPQVPSWAQVAGTAYHSLTEFLDHRIITDDDWTTDRDEISALWEEYLAVAVAEQQKRTDAPVSEWKATGRASRQWPNKEDREFWEKSGPSWVLNYLTWRMNNPSWEVADINGAPAIEAEIGGTFRGASLPLIGYIDRVFYNPTTKEHMVVDIKSGTRTPADTLQLGTYSLMLDLMYGIRPRWGAFWMARTGSTSVPADLHRDWPHERLEHEILTAEKIIRGEALSCNVGGFAASSSAAQFCYACTGIQEDTLLPWEVSLKIPDFSTSHQA